MDSIKWGEDLERDCDELRRLESWGLYWYGHHDKHCPLENCPHRKPREKNNDCNEKKLVV